ncbi:putative chloride channel protein, partial [Fulvia fulva]
TLSQNETGLQSHVSPADAIAAEEIAEIKRYEDFTTIDWVQDAARENQRRKVRRQERANFFDAEGKLGWRRKVWEAYDAGQGWIVITLIGAAIGLNAAILNIVTEWLSDVKLGYCTTAFYLNESFCCWGAESGCEEWHRWSSWSGINYVLYIAFSTGFAFVSARLVKSFAPYAAGSGISEIKCIIAGFVMKGFLGFWTLMIKSIGLPLAIASGLSVGKEGPSVHYAVCTGNVVSRMFDKYRRNAAKTREILSACAAAGVAVAFGSPIGGVLFSLEEMSNYFPLKTMWRSYFCALVATAVLAGMNPFRTGQLVMFTVRYDRSWHFFEIPFYIIIGAFGGMYGAFVMKWNLRAQAFRKRYLTKYAILEATLLALGTAIVCYPNMFLRIDMTESMEILFLECEGTHDYDKLCDKSNRWHMVLSLAIATVLRIFLVIISYGCNVPAGIFVPSMAIGASFGRMVGILVQALHESFPDAAFFAACKPDVPCITPGTYAFLGAGAALSGIMHLTVSVVVIMFELTGALTYILPTMIVVGVTKGLSEIFGKGGIADRMIWFNGFPFLDNKEEHTFGVPVSQTMTADPTVLPASGLTLSQVERVTAETKYQGFPIVEDLESSMLLGYIGRTELRYAIDRAKQAQPLSPQAKCHFAPQEAPRTAVPPSAITAAVSFDELDATAGAMNVDFSKFVDPVPLVVHPRLPLETAMELFKKLGPRVILIEHRGRVTGLVTVKDCLKYQFQAEAHENPRDDSGQQATQEKLWDIIRGSATWIGGKIGRASGGRLRLGDHHSHSSSPPDSADIRQSDGLDEEGRGPAAGGVELQDRREVLSRLSFLKRSTRCTVGMRMRQYVNVYLDDLAQPEEGQQITAEMFHAKGNAVRTAPTAGGTHSGNRTGSGKDFVAPRTLRWFTRGWTLQELIASSHVKFYCKTEKSIGALSDLVLPVSQVTGIHVSLLKHQRLLASFSIAQRMNWASKRVTTRVEDRAYSLLGIFNVNMPVIYGEGAKAFQRLQEEILRAYSDHTIFAWRPSGPEETRSYRQDLLASSPADFHHPSFKCLRKTPRGSSQREYEITARNVTFDLPVLDVPVARRGSKSHPTHTVAMLNCGHEDRLTSHITLVLYKNSTGDYSRASLH